MGFVLALFAATTSSSRQSSLHSHNQRYELTMAGCYRRPIQHIRKGDRSLKRLAPDPQPYLSETATYKTQRTQYNTTDGGSEALDIS